MLMKCTNYFMQFLATELLTTDGTNSDCVGGGAATTKNLFNR